MRRLTALLGAIALGVGAVVAVAPTRLPTAVTGVVDPGAVPALVDRAVLGAAGVVFLVTFAARALVPTQPVPPVRIGDNTAVADDAPVTGLYFDARIDEGGVEQATSGLPKSTAGPRLDEALVAVYARANGVSRREAIDAVRSGEWTDDRDAALLFATDSTPAYRDRLEGWLRPETVLERRIDAAMAELDRLTAELPANGVEGRTSTQPETADAQRAATATEASSEGSA